MTVLTAFLPLRLWSFPLCASPLLQRPIPHLTDTEAPDLMPTLLLLVASSDAALRFYTFGDLRKQRVIHTSRRLVHSRDTHFGQACMRTTLRDPPPLLSASLAVVDSERLPGWLPPWCESL